MPNDIPDWSQLVSIVSGELTVSDVKVTGILGAVSVSRWVGAVAGATPTGGPYVQGDWVDDFSLGGFRVCTVGGSPGTWVVAGSVLDDGAGNLARLSRQAGANGDFLIRLSGTGAIRLRPQDAAANDAVLSSAGALTLSNALSVPTAQGTALPTTSYGTVPLKRDEQSPSGVSSITIPSSGSLEGTFRKIRGNWKARTSSANVGDELVLQWNGITTANYDAQVIDAVGAAVSTALRSNTTALRLGLIPGGGAGAGLFNTGWFEIFSYADAVSRKSYNGINMRQDSSFGLEIVGGFLDSGSTAAITSLTVIARDGGTGNPVNFAAGSLFTTELHP